MNRRDLLKFAVALPTLAQTSSDWLSEIGEPQHSVVRDRDRVRPGSPWWPTEERWNDLRSQVGGRLAQVEYPLSACSAEATRSTCQELINDLQNPYFIRDQPGVTQVSGWANAWRSTPSAYVVRAKDANDVAAAVNFARHNNLRLVVKGGGHSYQGTSSAPDSLLVWTRDMNHIILRDAFVAHECQRHQQPQHAVTVGPGAVWMEVYDAVTTLGGRYVQGGGCATVGVAGLIQSGGFGSFSKHYGLAAAGLVEAEIVTADGKIRIANYCANSDLFWAIKGGGGGSFGIVTNLTLRTHELPTTFGDVSVQIRAESGTTFHQLIREFTRFYAKSLFNSHWGESVKIRRSNILQVDMVFQDLTQEFVHDLWTSFLSNVSRLSHEIIVREPFHMEIMAGRRCWDIDYLQKYSPGSVLLDKRPGAARNQAWWTGDNDQVGEFIHGYQSLWLPATLLLDENLERLADTLFESSRHWTVELHFNKGLAGAPAEALSAARDTAINPAALKAFALAIIAGGSKPDYSSGSATDPGAADAATAAQEITAAMDRLRVLAPKGGSYVSESNFFEADWQQAFWGENYPKLLATKRKYDPGGLFYVHHGIGSEAWSDDGFTRSETHR